MTPLPSPSPSSRALLGALACTAALVVAGCGGSDDAGGGAASAAATTASATAPAADSPYAPDPDESTPPGATIDDGSKSVDASTPKIEKAKRQGDFSAPAEAVAPTAKTVAARTGLKVTSPAGSPLKWTVIGKPDGNQFCVERKVPSHDPLPDCNTGTLLALQFFSDEASGHAIGAVDLASVDTRTGPTQLIVGGVAAADVKEVDVEYALHTYKAVLSEQSVQLPVSRSLARELSGATKAQEARLPAKVTIRVFGVSMPRDAGNPPQSVTSTTIRPVDGKMVLQLS